MTLNPRHYDVGELRTLAGMPERSASSEQRCVRDPHRSRAEQAAQSVTFTETVQLQRGGSSERRSRPYLEAVPHDPNAEHEVGKWLAYLIEVGGHDRARDALAYYREIGWLSEDAEAALAARLPGFDRPAHDRAFTAADHRVSLLSVVRLQSALQTHE